MILVFVLNADVVDVAAPLGVVAAGPDPRADHASLLPQTAPTMVPTISMTPLKTASFHCAEDDHVRHLEGYETREEYDHECD